MPLIPASYTLINFLICGLLENKWILNVIHLIDSMPFGSCSALYSTIPWEDSWESWLSYHMAVTSYQSFWRLLNHIYVNCSSNFHRCISYIHPNNKCIAWRICTILLYVCDGWLDLCVMEWRIANQHGMRQKLTHCGRVRYICVCNLVDPMALFESMM